MKILYKLINYIRYKLRFFIRIILPQTILASLMPRYVQSGIFKSMRYGRGSTGSVVLPKLVGTYEHELTSVLGGLSRTDYRLFIDVGAAEGYYAVGITKWLLNDVVPCIAFESSVRGQRQIQKLAKLNQTRNVDVRGHCTIEVLKESLISVPAFLLVDIEGGEDSLLDPQQCPALRQCDVLVELHPNVIPDIRMRLQKRFENTHTITEYVAKPEQKTLPAHIKPGFIKLFDQYVVNEFRDAGQSWLFLQYKRDAV